MRRKKPPPSVSPFVLPAYGIALVSATVSMVQGGVWASLAVFGLSLLAATAVEVVKLRT